MTNGACPVCKTNDPRPLFSKNGYDYVCCGFCGHGYMSPLPSEEQAAAVYEQSYFEDGGTGGYQDYVADEQIHRDNARARLRLLDEHHQGPKERLIDVGCAAGFYSDEARKAGWAPLGVEVSDYARAIAASRFGIEAVSSLSELDAREESFDAFCLFQVLEHMVDVHEVLDIAHRVTRPGASLIIETWDRGSAVAKAMGAAWQQVTPPSVLHLFNRKSLTLTLERSGFTVKFMGATSKRVSVGFATALLAGKSRGLIRTAFDRLSTSPLGGVAVPYRLGDLITAVAVRG